MLRPLRPGPRANQEELCSRWNCYARQVERWPANNKKPEAQYGGIGGSTEAAQSSTQNQLPELARQIQLLAGAMRFTPHRCELAASGLRSRIADRLSVCRPAG